MNQYVSKDLPPPLLGTMARSCWCYFCGRCGFCRDCTSGRDDAGIFVVMPNKEEVATSVLLIKVEAEIGVAVAPAPIRERRNTTWYQWA